MPAPDLPPATDSPLDLAQAAFDAGRFGQALPLLRSLDRARMAGPARLLADSLQCRAAFRVGELQEAVERSRSVLEAAPVSPSSELPARFDVLAVAVPSCAELGLYDESLDRLRDLLGLASRLGELSYWVRARGSAASCFSLLGDVWAGERVLAELAGAFLGPDLETRLEATVRNNHVSVCLLLARAAQAAGEHAAAQQSLEAAAASLARCQEIAQRLADARVAAFLRVHELELALLRGEPMAPCNTLDETIAQADAGGLAAHARQLRLLHAELLLAAGQGDDALQQLQRVQALLRPGHELSSRIRVQQLLHLAWRRRAELQAAHTARDEAERLLAWRHFHQSQAQSRFVRVRLELEHLYRQRPSASAGLGTMPR